MTDKIRQGIIEHQELPRFITKSNTNVINFNTEQSPTIVSLAHGDTDYLLIEDTSIASAWSGPFETGSYYWLYWDIDLETSERTFGHTQVEPSFGETLPPSPVLDEHFFDLNINKMLVWDGSKWQEKIRVFAGTLDESLTLNPKGNYSQINVYGNYNVNTILVDRFGVPVTKFIDDGTVEFITSQDGTINIQNNISTFTYGKLTEYYGIASEDIPKNYCVCWDNDLKVKLASYADINNPSFGISVDAVSTGGIVKIITHGFVKNRNDWAWGEPENTNIFVGMNGEITTSNPQTDSSQRIGYIVSPNTIFLNFAEQILIDPVLP